MNRLTAAFAFLALLTATPLVQADSPSYKGVNRAMSGSPACTAFDWEGGGPGDGGIILPARINGKAVKMQLDTGAETTETYGKLAIEEKWAKPGQRFYFPSSLSIANITLSKPRVLANPEMSADSVVGTLGLDELIGHVVVIDYPASKLCIFTAESAPSILDNVPGVHGSISQGRFLLPASSATFSSQRMLFDTGTSRMEMVVDASDWLLLTGLSTRSHAPYKLRIPSWGKTITLDGAETKSPLVIGKMKFPRAGVFTMDGKERGLLDPTYDGVIGNKLFIHGIVVLDLSSQAWFGFVAK